MCWGGEAESTGGRDRLYYCSGGTKDGAALAPRAAFMAFWTVDRIMNLEGCIAWKYCHVDASSILIRYNIREQLSESSEVYSTMEMLDIE